MREINRNSWHYRIQTQWSEHRVLICPHCSQPVTGPQIYKTMTLDPQTICGYAGAVAFALSMWLGLGGSSFMLGYFLAYFWTNPPIALTLFSFLVSSWQFYLLLGILGFFVALKSTWVNAQVRSWLTFLASWRHKVCLAVKYQGD